MGYADPLDPPPRIPCLQACMRGYGTDTIIPVLTLPAGWLYAYSRTALNGINFLSRLPGQN